MRATFISVTTAAMVLCAREPALSQAITGHRIISYPTEVGVTLGIGWDSRAGKKKNASCIEADITKDPGEDKNLIFRRVVDVESLMRSLSVSVEAKANGIVGSASGSVNFSKSVSFNSEDVNISAVALVVQGTQFLIPKDTKKKLQDIFGGMKIQALSADNSDLGPWNDLSSFDRTSELAPTLSMHAIQSVTDAQISLSPPKARLAASDRAEFERECGDGFISALVGGGSVEVLYSFANREEKEREDISTALSGSYAGFSTSASVKSILEKYSKQATTKIFYHQGGGSGDPLPISQDQLETKIQQLPALVKESPRPFRLTFTPYSELPNWPTKAIGSKSDIEHIASMYYQLLTLRLTIDDMLKNPTEYILDLTNKPLR
jgi:hypothetical protein